MTVAQSLCPPAQNSWGSPKLPEFRPEHQLPPQSPWGSWVWESKEPGGTFSMGLAQESTGQTKGECSGCSSPVGSARAVQKLGSDSVSCPEFHCHMPLSSSYCSGRSPSKPQRQGSLLQGTGRREGRGRHLGDIQVPLYIPHPSLAPHFIPLNSLELFSHLPPHPQGSLFTHAFGS